MPIPKFVLQECNHIHIASGLWAWLKYTCTWRVKFGIRKLAVLQSDWTVKILQLFCARGCGYACVLVVRDGALSINSLSGQLLSVLQLNWVAWDV